MHFATKWLSVLAITSIIGTILCSVSALYWVDGGRTSVRYSVEIPSEKNQFLVYRMWEPVSISEAENKGNHVVVLFHGFSATQSMMYPLMRLLTARGYWVITADFRGHGESGGIYRNLNSDRLEDFDLILADAQKQTGYPALNWSHLTIVGHSMGGSAVTYIGTQRNDVFITIGVAPAEFGVIANATRPGNFAVISGSKDQFFTPDSLLTQFQSVVPDGEIGVAYGNPESQNAKMLSIIPNARHESEMADNGCLGMAVGFIEYCYGFQSAANPIEVNINLQTTFAIVAAGFSIIATLTIGLLFNYRNQNNNQNLPSEIQSIEQIQKENLSEEILTKSLSPSTIMKYWYIYYIIGVLLAFMLFGILVTLIPSGFASAQIVLVAIPGFTSLLILLRMVQTKVKNQSDAQKGQTRKGFIELLQKLLKATRIRITGKSLGLGLILFGITALLLNVALAEYYLALFPLNNRAFYGLIVAPLNFFLWLPQIWILYAHYQEKVSSYGKALGGIFILKFGLILGLGILALLGGMMTITFLLLFCLVEFVATALISITIKMNGNYMMGTIWAALTNTFIYLGYGTFMTMF
jgi:pimeloyl-ACP methyl ester carboxylesterase